MTTKDVFNKVAFHERLREITLLYDLLCEHILIHGVPRDGYEVPTTFVLTTAFGEVFSDLRVISGRCAFINDVDEVRRKVAFNFIGHHWLEWRDESHIIDIVPVDGEFGVSMPQIVFHKETMKRFFKSNNVYPEDWGINQKIRFDNQVNDLVEVLKILNKKVPL